MGWLKKRKKVIFPVRPEDLEPPLPDSYRYYSRVLPVPALLPKDGLLCVELHSKSTEHGHFSYGYVEYDHKLPAKQRKAYHLEFDRTVQRRKEYPPFPNIGPEDARTVLAILHPELVSD